MQLSIGICLLLWNELNLLMMLTDWDMVEEKQDRESTSLTEEDTKAELAKLVQSILHFLYVVPLYWIGISRSDIMNLFLLPLGLLSN